MSHRVIIRPQAEADMVEAALWYEHEKPGLGGEFLAESDRAILAAAASPFHFPCFRRQPEVRRVLLRRFPYRLFFIRRESDIVVFRVLHGARRDDEWESAASDGIDDG